MKFRIVVICTALLFTAGLAQSEEAPQPNAKISAASKTKSKNKIKAKEQKLGGMSIVGNDEAPKSLAIVPWKGSQLGETLDALKALDGGRQPVDKEVFVRELDYYQIMAGAGETRATAGKSRQQ